MYLVRKALSGILLLGAAVVISGCSTSATHTETVKVGAPETQVRNIPGVVEYIWEEPMIDVVDVPPGLDPEGAYYRPAHQEVVEVRQGRWQYYRRAGK